MKPVLFADDPSFWFETLRTLGHTAYGGADIGEVLTTCGDITEGDYDSWHDEWLATADRVSAEAEKMLADGHRISARDGLMRANNYYRAAEFFLHGNPADPRIDHAYQRSRECFATAAALFDPPIEPVEIPYEGTVLRGYFYPRGPDRHAATPDDDPAQRIRRHLRRDALDRGCRRSGTRIPRADLRRTRATRGAPPRGSGLPPRLGERHHPGDRLAA